MAMYRNYKNSSSLALLTLVVLLMIYINVSLAARDSLRTIVKLTDMRCRATAPQLMYFEECTLKRDENITKAITLCRIYDKPLKQVKFGFLNFKWGFLNISLDFSISNGLNVRGYRKSNVGYVPFVLDLTLDWCEFLKNRNNIVLQRMFGLLEKESNLNTKCPIYLDYTYMNASMDNNGVFFIPFKWPTGDYRFDVTIDANEEIRLIKRCFV
ncbi:hypothetical protein FF38_05905 [Lucilia cuprina]|uniref:MD-2-related lipid-recognition domain-containing protein n=1 Tax=Lucilia cuprina TaxID=7375 RepID=A0A0L0CSB4_LUCCU|nr:hypothetical protein FF38_05905 [Lucilia cuprina]